MKGKFVPFGKRPAGGKAAPMKKVAKAEVKAHESKMHGKKAPPFMAKKKG